MKSDVLNSYTVNRRKLKSIVTGYNKLLLDSDELLEVGKPWKVKHANLLGRDSESKTVTEQLKNKQLGICLYIFIEKLNVVVPKIL